MHLTILSRSLRIYSTRRLVQAARLRGARVRVLDPLRVQMQVTPDGSTAFHKGRALTETDVVVPRIAPSIQAYGLAVLNQFSLLGVPTLNGADGIAASRNKLRALQMLSRAGIPVPPTVMASSAADLAPLVERVGGVPVLVKLLTPSERPGVMVCESVQSMQAALEAVLSMGHNLMVQRYVRRNPERDLRALVVGDRVLAWVERRARPGKLLRTLAWGAKMKAVRVPSRLDDLALSAARVIGLDVAAVDLLDLDGRSLVFDVHSSPGLKELERATGKDLALPMVGLAEQLSGRSPSPKARPARRPRAARA